MQTLLPGPNEADKRQFIVSGLIPYNNYRFRVYASNAYLDPGEISRPTGKIIHTYTLKHLSLNIVHNLLQIIWPCGRGTFVYAMYTLTKMVLKKIDNIDISKLCWIHFSKYFSVYMRFPIVNIFKVKIKTSDRNWCVVFYLCL